MKQYKAIFLDWDDTIGDFIGAAHRALQQMYGVYHLEGHFRSFDQFYQLYHQHNLRLWEQYGRSEITKDYLAFDRFFFPLMMAEKPFSLEEAMRLAPIIGHDFLRTTTDFFALLPDAEEVVRTLASKYPLTIVSNGFSEVQYEKINRSGLRSYFAHVVLSEEVGVQKPNPKIFEQALQLNHLSAEDVIMIGDSWNSDIQGAINAGIDQVWICPIQQHNLADKPATYHLTTLRDVLSLLM